MTTSADRVAEDAICPTDPLLNRKWIVILSMSSPTLATFTISIGSLLCTS